MSEVEEIIGTIESLRDELDNLVVRGLRAAGPESLARIRAMQEELQRIGAGYLAERLQELILKIDADDRGSAAALLTAQASLRMFDRVLSLEVAAATLGDLAAVQHPDRK